MAPSVTNCQTPCALADGVGKCADVGPRRSRPSRSRLSALADANTVIALLLVTVWFAVTKPSEDCHTPMASASAEA